MFVFSWLSNLFWFSYSRSNDVLVFLFLLDVLFVKVVLVVLDTPVVLVVLLGVLVIYIGKFSLNSIQFNLIEAELAFFS